MKILHVLDHSIPIHSGYTFRTRAILEQQRALGWETAHLTSGKHELAIANTGWTSETAPGKSVGSDTRPLEEDVDGLRFYRTSKPKGVGANLPVANHLWIVNSLARRLEQVIAKERPAILHAHSPALNGLASLRVGKKLDLPVVYEARAFWEDAAVSHGSCREGGIRYRMTRALETHVFRNADAITTICDGLKNEIVSRGIVEDKVTVVPNAVDLARFPMHGDKNPELVEQLDLTGKNVFGFIGSFYAYEGLALLLRAMPHILAQEPKSRLLLVGGGPEDANLKRLTQRLRITDKVVFTGRVPHEVVNRYYDLIDILIYPRTPMRLTDIVTPLKPLEAMARGCLVIASDVGGHRELIRNGENGLLFRASSEDSLTDSVINLIRHPENWTRQQDKARRFVEQQRNWPVSVAQYAPLYERIVNKQRTSTPDAAAVGGI